MGKRYLKNRLAFPISNGMRDRKSKILLAMIFCLMFIGGFLMLPNSTKAATTLSNTFVSRGMSGDLKYACYNNGGTNRYYYRKYTNNELFPDTVQVGDFVFICMSAPFSGWEAVNLSTPISSTSHTIVYEYWNGTAWTALSGLTDGTNMFTQNGQITWTMPTDWETWRYDNNTKSKAGAYAQYLVRCRITAVSGWTEGGYLTGYQKVRQKYININDGGSHTPASLYADDVANGWGVITKKGDYAYDISCGVYFGNATFTFDSTKIKIGDAGSPNYVPFKVFGATMLCNDSATYMSDDLASALIVYSKGSAGTITFYPSKNSRLYNLYLAQPYDTHYSRFSTGTYGGTGQAQWYNVLIGSMMYTGGSHNFVRMNFQNIQYLLSAGDTIYDSCIFGTRFNKDPGYAPVVTRPTFDGGSSAAHDWISYYYPDSATRQHHLDVISGTWTKGNKWKCYCDDAYPDSTKRSHIMIYSNYLNIKIQDRGGNPINGAKLSIKDQYGNSALWEDLDVYLTSSPSDTLDTSWVVNNASDLNIGDKLLYWGEIVKITNIAGNTLTVERGLESSARVFNLKDYYVPLRRRVATMTIDGSKDEIYVPERIYYRYSLDGGITSTGNLYRDYNPFIVRIDHQDYPSKEFELTIDEEKNLTIALKDKPTSAGSIKVWGTEYADDEAGTIYAQVFYGDGSPCNTLASSSITATVYKSDGTKIIDGAQMTYVEDSNGIYKYDFLANTFTDQGVYIIDVMASSTEPNITAYDSNEIHVSKSANLISQNLDQKISEVASSTAQAVWSYTGSALDTAGNAISKVWSFATRKLSSRQIADEANEHIAQEENIASNVWGEDQSGYAVSGTFGYYLNSRISAVASDVWNYTSSIGPTLIQNLGDIVWNSYSGVRKLTSRQIGENEYIAGVSSSSTVSQVAAQSTQENVEYNVELVRKATFDFAGFADGGSTTTLVDSELTQPDDHWNNYELWMMSGNNIGLKRAICDFDRESHIITLCGDALSQSIGANDQYVISHERKLVHSIWNWTDRQLTSVGNIASAVWGWTESPRKLTSRWTDEATPVDLAQVADVSGLATSAELATAKTDIIAEINNNETLINNLNNISAQEVWEYGTRGLTGSVSLSDPTQVWDIASSALTEAGSIGKQITDNLDAQISTRSALTAADVWSESTRTLTDYATSSIALAVWNNAQRTLTSYGNDITAADVWNVLNSTLTTENSIGKQLSDNVDATISSRAPSSTALSSITWTDEKAEYLDATISSRASQASINALNNISVDDVWSYANRSITDPDAIWEYALTQIGNTGSIGLLLKNNIDATVSSRSSHTAADVWNVVTRTLTSNDNFNDPTSAQIAADVWAEANRTLTNYGNDITAAEVWEIMSNTLTTNGTIGKQLAENVDAKISSRSTQTSVNSLQTDINYIRSKTDSIYTDTQYVNGKVDEILTKWGAYSAADIMGDLDTVKSRIGTSTDSSSDETLFGRTKFIKEKWGTQTAQTIYDTAKDAYDTIVLARADIGYATSSTAVYDDIVLLKGYTDDLEILTGHPTDSSSANTLFGRVKGVKEETDKLIENIIVVDASVNGSNASTTQFVANLTQSTDDFYNNNVLVFTSGTNAGQVRRIIDYDGTLKKITVDPALAEAPANDNTFSILSQTAKAGIDAQTIWTYGTRVLTAPDLDSGSLATLSDLQKQWTVYLSDFREVLAGNIYRAKLWVLNYESVPTDAFATTTLTIYDAVRNKVVENVEMTKISTGIYEYTYSVPSGAVQGVWETDISVEVEAGKIIKRNDYWEVEGSPAQVKINSITDKTVPSVSANVTISNEGSAGYEYQYEWCAVSSEDNHCGGDDDIFYSSAAKYIQAGEDWNTALNATVSNAGSYWFKMVVYYGTEKSGASQTFTAVEEERGREEVLTPRGGGGGIITLEKEKEEEKPLSALATTLDWIEKPLKRLASVEKKTTTLTSSVTRLEVKLAELDKKMVKVLKPAPPQIIKEKVVERRVLVRKPMPQVPRRRARVRLESY